MSKIYADMQALARKLINDPNLDVYYFPNASPNQPHERFGFKYKDMVGVTVCLLDHQPCLEIRTRDGIRLTAIASSFDCPIAELYQKLYRESPCGKSEDALLKTLLED